MKIKTKYDLGNVVIISDYDELKIATINACEITKSVFGVDIVYKIEFFKNYHKTETEINESDIIARATKKLIKKYLEIKG